VKKFLYLFFILVLQIAQADTKPKICLNMIVKNEEPVIERCLATVKPHIDYWVIVDTGSSDNTIKKIKEFMKDVPGELHECPWQNFEYNRNQALDLARSKGDYILFIDADEQLVFDKGFSLPQQFDYDGYLATVRDNDVEFLRMLLISTKKNWFWKGVMHETIMCTEAHKCDVLKNMHNLATADGARSRDPKKYERDAQSLEKALVFEPDNSRYMFYLGQSYLNCAQYENALKAYQRRVVMGGWDQEIYWSLYMIGRIQEILKQSEDQILLSYARAFEFRPNRAEPLSKMADILLRKGSPRLALLCINEAKNLSMPVEGVFVEKNVYNYVLDIQKADALHLIGQKEEAKNLFNKVLNMDTVPEMIKLSINRHITENLDKK
jgi:glycosyltransferase involved in cell wall biosynthesis